MQAFDPNYNKSDSSIICKTISYLNKSNRSRPKLRQASFKTLISLYKATSFPPS
ncbi:hypothetical protein Hanom_Chr12g01100421 [Helianthus anomalus]